MLVVFALSDPVASSEFFSDYQIAVQMGIDTIPTYLFDRSLVVQGMHDTEAMKRILTTAWEQVHPNVSTQEETH